MSDNKKKCRGCADSLDRQGIYCSSCCSKKSLRQTSRRNRFLQNGLCACGREPRSGYTYCPRCLRSRRQRQKRRRKRHRAAGLCAQCSTKSNGKHLCPRCMKAHIKRGTGLARKLRRVARTGRVCDSCWRPDEITPFFDYRSCCRACEHRRRFNGLCPTCDYAMYWPMNKLPQCPWCHPEYRLQGYTFIVDRLAGTFSTLLRSIGRQIEAEAERKQSEWAHAGWRTVRKAVFRLRHLNELHGWIGRREYAAATPGNDKAASRHWWRLLKHLENYNIPHEVRTREARKEVMVLMPKYDIMGPPPRPRA